MASGTGIATTARAKCSRARRVADPVLFGVIDDRSRLPVICSGTWPKTPRTSRMACLQALLQPRPAALGA